MRDKQCSSCGGNCGGGYTTNKGNYIHCKQERFTPLRNFEETMTAKSYEDKIAELEQQLAELEKDNRIAMAEAYRCGFESGNAERETELAALKKEKAESIS